MQGLLLSFISEIFMFLLVSMNAPHFLEEKKVTPGEKSGQAAKNQGRNDYIPFLS
ncbi:MAG: hypothetical protein JWQ40_896 [Segetibacter sp.]|nr:hypothetical protein [Segetibacter sp.]